MTQTGEMTFWDHLEELRGSLFRMIGVYAVAVIVLFCFKGFLFDNIILAPSKPDFFLYRLLGADFSMTLVNIEVAAQFLIHMKITFICALIVTFPYLVFEIWKFIAPALYEKEKKEEDSLFTKYTVYSIPTSEDKPVRVAYQPPTESPHTAHVEGIPCDEACQSALHVLSDSLYDIDCVTTHEDSHQEWWDNYYKEYGKL